GPPEPPGGRADAQAFSQAAEDPEEEDSGGRLAEKEGAEGLEKGATTSDAEQLAPGPATGMAVGAEIAPAHPAPIGTVRVGAKVHRGVDLAAAPPRGHHAWWRG